MRNTFDHQEGGKQLTSARDVQTVNLRTGVPHHIGGIDPVEIPIWPCGRGLLATTDMFLFVYN